MTPDQWAKTKALFGDLAERDSADWTNLLASEPDPLVAGEVQRLLTANQTDAEFLNNSPATALSEHDHLIGHLLGPFRIERLLGEGGGGRVYLAQRDDVGGYAAVKILRGHFAGPEASRRFHAEQAILARLDHPNIARLLQVGVTEEAVPWLAMEYVDGRPFAEVMATLSIRERLQMVIKLLDAIDYAHRQLVVHRDLKPGNILVDRRNEPRLLDFGIAKRLDDVDMTRTRFQPRTPAYAAPEQVLGEPITVATDVYTTGVLLYEVLSGSKPWSGTASQLEAAILSGDAPLPSRVVGETSRRSIKGDLDAIVMQAMQRDPRRRYPSAAAMARDLQNVLEHRPVSAQKATLVYRGRRYLVRNRRWVAVIVIAFALLSFALVREHDLRRRAALEAKKATLEAQKATQVANFMVDVFDAGDALTPGFAISKDSTVLDLMARGTARLDTLTSAPLVRADLAQKMGQVYWGLSEFSPAETLFKTAIELREQELGASNETAESYLMLGRVYSRTSRYPEMLTAMQTSYDMRFKLLGANDLDTIRSQHRAGVAWYFNGDLHRADATLIETIAAARKQLPASAIQLSNSLTMHAFCLSDWGRFDEAVDAYREALNVRQSVLPSNHNLIGEGLNNLARGLFDLGKIEQALSMVRAALSVDEQNFQGDHNDLVLDYVPYAKFLLAKGDLVEASAQADKAVAMATRLNRNSPLQETLDRARQVKVEVLRAQGDTQAALDMQRDVVRTRQQTLPAANNYMIGSHSVLADLLRSSGHIDEANMQLKLALDGWRKNPDRHVPVLVESMNAFADAGICEWLDADWPMKASTGMAAAIERNQRICSSVRPAQ